MEVADYFNAPSSSITCHARIALPRSIEITSSPCHCVASPAASSPACRNPVPATLTRSRLLRQRTTWRAYLVDALREQHTRYGYVGQTATDGPDGYSVDSATLVSPILLAALSGDPELPFIDETLQLLVDRGVSPMAMNYDFATGWQGDDVISIDLGSAILAWRVIEELGALK